MKQKVKIRIPFGYQKPKNFHIDRRYYNMVGTIERRILTNGAIVRFGKNNIFVPFDLLEHHISPKEKDAISKIAKFLNLAYTTVEWMYQEYGQKELIKKLKERKDMENERPTK